MSTFMVLSGPNLNLLGTREPEIYGSVTLAEIEANLDETARSEGHSLICRQTNAEHELIHWIHEAPKHHVDAIILNAGALTHTSMALRDALLAVDIPFVEVHVSNPYQRESFRHTSYLSDVAEGTILGFGPMSYILGLQAAMSLEMVDA